MNTIFLKKGAIEKNVEGGGKIWKAVLSDGDNGGHDDDVDTEYEVLQLVDPQPEPGAPS